MDIQLMDKDMIVGTIYHQVLEKYSKMYQSMVKNSKNMNKEIMTHFDVNILNIKGDIRWDKVSEIINAQQFIFNILFDWHLKYDDVDLITVLKLADYFVMDELHQKIAGIIDFTKMSDYICLKNHEILYVNKDFNDVITKIFHKKEDYMDLWAVTNDSIGPNVHLADIAYYMQRDGYNDPDDIIYDYFDVDHTINADTNEIIKNFMEEFGSEQLYIHVSIVDHHLHVGESNTHFSNYGNSIYNQLYLSSLNNMKNIVQFTEKLYGAYSGRCVGYCYITGKYVGHLKHIDKEYPVYDLMYYCNTDT